jgi:hypothetical protein
MRRRDFLKALGMLPAIWGGNNKYWPKDVPCDAIVENGCGKTWYTANLRDDNVLWKRIDWAEMRCDEGTYYLPIFEMG